VANPNDDLTCVAGSETLKHDRTRIKVNSTTVPYLVQLEPSKRYQVAHLGITAGFSASVDVVKVSMSRSPQPLIPVSWPSGDEEVDTELLSPTGVAACTPRKGTRMLAFVIADADQTESMISISVTESIEAGFEV